MPNMSLPYSGPRYTVCHPDQSSAICGAVGTFSYHRPELRVAEPKPDVTTGCLILKDVSSLVICERDFRGEQ